MYYFIAFYSDKDIILEDNIIDKCIFLDDSYKIIDNFSARKNHDTIYFDYLITDKSEILKELGAEFDNNCVLINYDFQTSLENTFAFSKVTTSSLDEKMQIKKILNYIFEN